MAGLRVFLATLAVCGLDVVKGEIPNEIQQFVLSLLQEHNGEVMELKQEILSLRQQVSSLQMSYLKVLHELDDLRQNKIESVPMKTEMDDRIQKIHTKNSSSQNVTQSNGPQNSAGDQLLPQDAKQTRKGRLVAHSVIGNSGYPAAFSAYMSSNPSHLQHNQILAFDSVILNNGNAYDGTSGTFTPTSKGVYAVFSTITTTPGKSLEAEIVKNNFVFCRIYAGDNTLYSPGSNMAVIDLNIGDRVLVRIHNHYHDDGVTIDGAFSSFSGYLLYETD